MTLIQQTDLTDLTKMSTAQLLAYIAQQHKDRAAAVAAQHQAEAERDAVRKASQQKLTLKVSEKGGLSVYGLGKWPVTLYAEQWIKILDIADQIRDMIAASKDRLTWKH